MVTAYCVRCKDKVEMQEPFEDTQTSRGVPMRKGSCPNCKGKVCRIGKIE